MTFVLILGKMIANVRKKGYAEMQNYLIARELIKKIKIVVLKFSQTEIIS
jgi:hypothetical protein